MRTNMLVTEATQHTIVISVSLKPGRPAEPFIRGFALQMRQTGRASERRVGAFSADTGTRYRVHCDEPAAVTHSKSTEPRKELNFTWTGRRKFYKSVEIR